jgi:transposase-like protein
VERQRIKSMLEKRSLVHSDVLAKIAITNTRLMARPAKYQRKKRKEALRIYYSGVSSRGVGKILGMGKSNVLNRIKKLNEVWISRKTNTENFEMDEIYWFINKKERSKT